MLPFGPSPLPCPADPSAQQNCLPSRVACLDICSAFWSHARALKHGGLPQVTVCQALGQVAFRLEAWSTVGTCQPLLVQDHFQTAVPAQCWVVVGMAKFNLMPAEVSSSIYILFRLL